MRESKLRVLGFVFLLVAIGAFCAQSGSSNPSEADELSRQVEQLYDTGKYSEAIPLAKRALQLRENALGSEHPGTAQSLNNLAALYRQIGDYAKAGQLFQRALQIRENALGPDHPDTATTLNDLAEVYLEISDYRAESLLERAVQIREKTFGPEDPKTAESLGNLAWVYYEMGDFAKAEPLFERTLKISEKVLGPEHLGTATDLNNLALFYRDMGDYAKAEPLLERALKIREKARGSEHRDMAESLANLAALYDSMGDYAKAEPLYQRAIKIDEKTLGPKHPHTATDLNLLARLYREMGDYAKAELLLQRALKIREKALGREHSDAAISLNDLATLYRETGDYAKAERLYQRALKIKERALGSEHPDTAAILTNLAMLKIAVGNQDVQATDLIKKAYYAGEKHLSNMLSFTSEQQRLAFQKTIRPYNLPGTLGDAPQLAKIVLRQKGLVLDSLLEDRLVAEASEDPKQRNVITEVRSAKQRLMKLQLEVPQDLSRDTLKRRRAETEQLSRRVEEEESGLARQVAGLGRARRALAVTVQQVQSSLGRGQALVELIRYEHYLGKNQFEPRYGAVVITAAGEPKWVPLGSAAAIEKNVRLYQKSARGATDESTMLNTLQTLFTQVWGPIEKALPESAKQLVLCPDGQLNFVSFATLLGPDDKFVAEKYSVRYAASGRDLLRESKPSGSQMMLVYANPDFEGKTTAQSPSSGDTNAVALRSVEMRDLQDLSLPPLPGTAAEADALEKRMGKSIKMFLGADATESQLRQVNSPRILHLATHGFFLPEVDLGKPASQLEENIPKGKLVNPMHRSGLALAGAQKTLEAWSRGEVPPTENDGIVTAEEVGGLKLDGTWLVVLSACDTGAGEARAGEGVMGLRRGFIQAGAQNLLMTLWAISDKTTVQIMLDFYDAAEKTKNAPQALADVQRDWLVKLRKERGLLNAVRLAGAFIMSSQGTP